MEYYDTFASLSEICSNQKVFNEPGYDIRTPISDGTTIIGVIYKDGVMLACDTRTSSGNFISHKSARKINKINENIFVCRCGASSDSQKLIELTKYLCEATKGENRKRGRPRFREQTQEELSERDREGPADELAELIRLNNESDPGNVIVHNKYFYIDKNMSHSPLVRHVANFAKTLIYDYKDYFNCALIFGGYDRVEKQQLYCVYVNGSVIKKDTFIALGSGSVYVQAYIQDRYKKDMKKTECFDLIMKAVKYAIYNDNKSGGIIRIVNISKDLVEEYTVTNSQIHFNY